MMTCPRAISERSGSSRLVRPDRSVSHAIARPTTSTAYPASVQHEAEEQHRGAAHEHGRHEPDGMRADVGRCCEGGGGHVASIASADAGGKSRSCARPGADADAARGRPRCRQDVSRSMHDADAPALHSSVAARGDRAALPARPHRARSTTRGSTRAADAARRSLHARRAAARVACRRRAAVVHGARAAGARRAAGGRARHGAAARPPHLRRRGRRPAARPDRAPRGPAAQWRPRRRPGLRRARRHVRDVRTRVRPRLDRRRRHAARGHRALRRPLRQRLLGRRAHGVRRRRRRGVPRASRSRSA